MPLRSPIAPIYSTDCIVGSPEVTQRRPISLHQTLIGFYFLQTNFLVNKIRRKTNCEHSLKSMSIIGVFFEEIRQNTFMELKKLVDINFYYLIYKLSLPVVTCSSPCLINSRIIIPKTTLRG